MQPHVFFYNIEVIEHTQAAQMENHNQSTESYNIGEGSERNPANVSL